MKAVSSYFPIHRHYLSILSPHSQLGDKSFGVRLGYVPELESISIAHKATKVRGHLVGTSVACGVISKKINVLFATWHIWTYLCRHLRALLRVVFVRKTAVISFVVCPCNSGYLLRGLSLQQVLSVPLQHVRMYGVPLAIAAFSFLSDLAPHSSEHLSFVLLCFFISFSVIFLFLFFSCFHTYVLA